MLAYWLYQEKKYASHVSMTGGTLATSNKAPTEVRLLPSHGNWEIGVLSPLTFTFQTNGAQVLEKTFLGPIADKEYLVLKTCPVFKRLQMYFKQMRKYLQF